SDAFPLPVSVAVPGVDPAFGGASPACLVPASVPPAAPSGLLARCRCDERATRCNPRWVADAVPRTCRSRSRPGRPLLRYLRPRTAFRRATPVCQAGLAHLAVRLPQAAARATNHPDPPTRPPATETSAAST